jgi:hypothetical protein
MPSELTGAAGIEPAVAVLETAGLPLTDAPKLICTGRVLSTLSKQKKIPLPDL